MTKVPRLTATKLGSAWWILGDDEPMGPYPNRAEADDSRRHVLRFYRYQDEPGFITSCKPDDRWVKW